jgi:hypothetical protein
VLRLHLAFAALRPAFESTADQAILMAASFDIAGRFGLTWLS